MWPTCKKIAILTGLSLFSVIPFNTASAIEYTSPLGQLTITPQISLPVTETLVTSNVINVNKPIEVTEEKAEKIVNDLQMTFWNPSDTVPNITYIDEDDYLLGDGVEVKRTYNSDQITLESPIEYNVVEWDTLELLSYRYNIDVKYILESNKSLRYHKIDEKSPRLLEPNQSVIIPHKPWVIYKVNEGDTKYTIMNNFWFGLKTWAKYNMSDKVYPGQLIVLPENINTPKSLGGRNRTFAWWNCTWYVSNNLPGAINWSGNANRWIQNAKAKGHTVDMTPAKKSIIVMGWKGMPLGHVGLVESFTDTHVTLSEMNYTGLNKKSVRTLPLNHHSIKWYIHTKLSQL